MRATYTFMAVGLAAQQATATWNFFDKLNCPKYTNNECDAKQKSGFNFLDLNIGQTSFQYGDFDFSGGWKCAGSNGKRDLLSARTFGPKVIQNRCSKEKPASFGCNKRKDGFAISTIDVSVEYDVDLEFHYKMKDNSVCKQVSKCSKGGTTVKNTQCGGAVSVDVLIASFFELKEKKDCLIGFHGINFDCTPSTPYKQPPPPVLTPPKSTYVPQSQVQPSSSAKLSTMVSMVQPPPSQGVPSSSYQAESPSPSPSQGGGSPSSTENAPTGGIQTPTSGVATPTSGVLASSVPPYQNNSESAAKPTTTQPCGGANGQYCAVSTGVNQPAPSSSSAPITGTEVLPKCINTWLQLQTKCKDNTDKSCYCTDADFTKTVIDCVTAWCGTDEETRQSLKTLIGICAAYVPKNPGIVSNCPSYIPLNPTSSGTPAASASASASAAPAPAPSSGAYTVIAAGTTTVTVTQVQFQTVPAGSSQTAQPVQIIAGPPSTPAQTTGGPGGAQIPPYPTNGPSGIVATPTSQRVASTYQASQPSKPPAFTGAAVPFGTVPQGALFGAVLAFFAL